MSISVELSEWGFSKVTAGAWRFGEKDSDEPASFEAWVPGYIYLEIRNWIIGLSVRKGKLERRASNHFLP